MRSSLRRSASPIFRSLTSSPGTKHSLLTLSAVYSPRSTTLHSSKVILSSTPLPPPSRCYSTLSTRSESVAAIMEALRKSKEEREEGEDQNISTSHISKKYGFTIAETVEKSTSQPIYKLTKGEGKKITIMIPTVQDLEEDFEPDEEEEEPEMSSFFRVKLDKTQSGQGILEFECVAQDTSVTVENVSFRSKEEVLDKDGKEVLDFWDNNLVIKLKDETIASNFKAYMLEELDMEEIGLADVIDIILADFEHKRDDRFAEALKKFVG